MALFKFVTFEATNEEEVAKMVVRAETEAAARDFVYGLTGGEYGYFREGEDFHVEELDPEGPPAVLAEGANVV